MIVEWFVQFVRNVYNFATGWIDACTTFVNAVCQSEIPPMPELDTLMSWMATLDYASGGVVGSSLGAIGVYLCILLILFAFGLIRQVWRFVPFIGGG